MEEFLTESHIDDLTGVLDLNVAQYLQRYFTFIQNDYPRIVRFFRGATAILEEGVITELNSLSERSDFIAQRIQERRRFLNAVVQHDLVDYLEDLRAELVLIPRLWKFLRSSRTNFNFQGSFEFDHFLTRNETLEDATVQSQGGDDYQNEWQNVAIRNDLLEEDYNLEGGQRVTLSLDLNTTNIAVNSIIDSPNGIRVLGLDFQRVLEFENDDLKVLTHRDTFNQSVEILSSLTKGDVPEFRFFGRDSLVGRTAKTFGLASTVRQLQQIFSSDDSMFNLSINETSLEGSDVTIMLSVGSRLSNIVQQQLRL